jgi:hypothetical protein
MTHVIVILPPPKSEYFFQQHWESEYFFKKKKLNGRSLTREVCFKLNDRSLIDHEMNHENGGNSLWLIHIIIYLNKVLF